MTASEARRKAGENLYRATQSEFDQVIEQVEIAVKDGKLSTTYYGSLRAETINRLESEPNRYIVKYNSDWRDGGYYEITW